MSRKVLDTERPFHIEQYLQLLAQGEDPPDILNDVTQLWMSDGTDSGDSGDLYFKIHIGGDPGQDASHKLMDFAGNVFADGYMFADKAIAGGNIAVADGTVALDLTLGSNFTNTPSQNTVWTTVAPTDGIGGERCSFIVDNSGGFTVSWSTGFTNVDAVGAGDTGVHVRTLQFDGTTWHQIASTEDGEATNVTGGGGVFREVATSNVFGPSNAGRDALTGDYNFAAGDSALDAVTSGANNVAIGRNSLGNLANGIDNVAIGQYTLESVTKEDGNVAIGAYAGQDPADAGSADFEFNVMIGAYSAYNAVFMDTGNTFIGAYSGSSISQIGNLNIGIGSQALGGTNGACHWNIAIGDGALYDLTTGENNIGIGEDTLANATIGDYNVAYGVNALLVMVAGANNVAIGGFAGVKASAGSSRNVFLGYNVGPTVTAAISDLLYIDNHQTDTPLIEGDFSGHTIDINGTLSKTAGSFKIAHPLDEKKHLYHGFVEAPEYGLIYRGSVKLQNGKALVSINKACGMSPGVFEAIAMNYTMQSQNMSSFSPLLLTEITGDTFEIATQNDSSNDTVHWTVYAERCDKFIMDSDATNINGHLILERDKPARKLRHLNEIDEEIIEHQKEQRAWKNSERERIRNESKYLRDYV